MKTIKKIKLVGAVLFSFLFLIGCEGRREVEDTGEVVVETEDVQDTVSVVETGKTAEEQLEEFRTWLNTQAEKGDTAIRREWPNIKEELRRRNAQLEQQVDTLSGKTKQEYQQLQERYERWENRQERRLQQPLDPKKLSQWQELLLQEFRNPGQIEANKLREAYLTFMGVVRAKRQNWTADDWDYVDNVYGQLNQRRRQLENQISTADNLKIRALQAEYLALEGSADTQSMIRGSSDN